MIKSLFLKVLKLKYKLMIVLFIKYFQRRKELRRKKKRKNNLELRILIQEVFKELLMYLASSKSHTQ